RRGDVRRRNHLRELGQSPFRRWFTFEHVEAGAGDLAGLDGGGERRLVDEFSPSRVHDSNTSLAPGQAPRVEQVSRLRRGRKVKCQVVRGRTEIVERHQLYAERAGDLLGDERMVRGPNP